MLSLLETSTPRTRQRENSRYTFIHASYPSVAVAFFLFLQLQLTDFPFLFRQLIVTGTLLHSSESDVIAYFPRLRKKLLFNMEIFSTFVYRTVFGWVFMSSCHSKFNRNLRYFDYVTGTEYTYRLALFADLKFLNSEYQYLRFSINICRL